jgi:FeoB-associated Cys-rich membrane protein
MIQNLILLAILVLAAAYIGRRAWRTARAAVKPDAAGCGSGCGCSAPAAPLPEERAAPTAR